MGEEQRKNNLGGLVEFFHSDGIYRLESASKEGGLGSSKRGRKIKN